MRICNYCNEEKTDDDFYHEDHTRCKSCQSNYYKAKRIRENKEDIKPIKDIFLNVNGMQIF